MKIRILSFACVTTAAVLFAGCTAVDVYKNTDACEQMMRSKLADTSPETSSDKLTIAHAGAGIDGSRVVVEGSLEHVLTAAEIAKAAAVAAAASAAQAASAPHAASATVRASAAVAASNSAAAASAVSAASATSAASEAVAMKPAKPKKAVKATAVECTFSGRGLTAFRWLAPDSLAKPPADAASEVAE